MNRLMHRLKNCLLTSLAILPFAFPALAKTGKENQRIEVAFVLDTTGSMAGLIDGAKRKIWSIANTIVDVNPEADLRMALVVYRDYGDDYVVKRFQMSSDVQGLYGNLIKLDADGGGDAPEAVNEALDEAVRKLDWSQNTNAKRIVFLVGDAPPHMDYPNGPRYPIVVKQAVASSIIVNTVQAGRNPSTEVVWREIAQLGNGRYVAIAEDGGQINFIQTPYDDQVIQLQKRIDETVIPYGTQREREGLRSKMEEKAKAPAPVKVDNSRYYAKKGGAKEVVTGGGDLVADVKNRKQSLDTIKQADLPAILRGKTKAQARAVLDEKARERSELEQQMADLIEKRDAYIAKQATKPAGEDDSFDAVVKKTLREQLK